MEPPNLFPIPEQNEPLFDRSGHNEQDSRYESNKSSDGQAFVKRM